MKNHAHFDLRERVRRFGLCLLMIALSLPLRAEVPIVVLSDAVSIERIAAQELADGLHRLYPQERFQVSARLPDTGRCVLLGNAAANVHIKQLAEANLAGPESFAVFTSRDEHRELAVVAGADPRGTAHAVYALLAQLGAGYDLSGDTWPTPRPELFSFDGWQLADRPLIRDRLVFNWHNFLSGCSTWNLPDWNRWTDQSQKMGYNAIMVHAYGNNPMASFAFNGKAKPVGYLSTTVKGRDWSTLHVNDVRRIWGGEVFSQAAFGAAAALGPDEQRTAAAQQLMRAVFAHAEQRRMEVYFADDVDTVSANPQELILTLPAAARFPIGVQAMAWMNQEDGRMWLANPDTAEGYRYYRAQVEALLKAYPQITCLVVWFRTGGTPWMEVKVAEMPAAWQQEYEGELAKTPEAAELWHAPQVFALGKIVRAFDRALKELSSERVQLAAGTWDFKFLAPCDRFFPRHVKLIGLDYHVLRGQPQLADADSRKVIRDVGAHRAVIPVIWAHHDDGNYIGRPYTPFADFHSKLTDANAAGFGIIHWTTRPLDLFFLSHARQVWQSTRNQSLRATCEEMAANAFGPTASGPMSEYLERWVKDAPQFARETSDWFIDQALTNIEQVVAGCRERLKLIESADASKLAAEQRDRLKYFQGLEEFIAAFFQTHGLYQRSQALLKAGDLAGARAAMAECQPEPVIEQFARFSALGGITRGEQGLVVTLNTRWLSHLIGHRQALGMEPVRINFAPTQHDPLAQSRGRFTFFFDPDRKIWECRGEEETGAKILALSERAASVPPAARSADEICRTGVESDQPISFTIRPLMARGNGSAVLPPGEYRLRLLLRDPSSTAPDQRVFEVAVSEDSGALQPAPNLHRAAATSQLMDRVDIFRLAGQSDKIIKRSYPVTVSRAGAVKVSLTPVRGKALICGAVLESVAVRDQAQAAPAPATVVRADALAEAFRNPPPPAWPWVYWFWMDGNISREGITADLEAMHQAGIGGLILMEVDVGVPRGPARFMSDPWRALFKHAVVEAERLGLEITLNAGPGWTGSGGPWVKPEQSMQHLVASELEVAGPTNFSARLPRPVRRPAYFGEKELPPELTKAMDEFYVDAAVLAFPKPAEGPRIADWEEKALYLRHPYSSRPGTRPSLPAPAAFPAFPAGAAIERGRIVDLTNRLQPDGRLDWQVPPGQWIILRFGRVSTGANTRPAPAPGLGLECDKFDPAALDAHFEAFIGMLLRELGPRPVTRQTGWTTLHIDSWEMGAQNWTAKFREEFQRRRDYDPLRYLPTLTGRVVEGLELSERFLWDLRQTAQELVIENHAQHLKTLGRRHGFGLSIEPYDMNPCADLSLGGVADVPMGEFWAQGYGFQTAFSGIEAVSIAHTMGRPIVAAEAFTADTPEAWRLFPGAMKAQADWAFCLGINRLVFHRYAHQPWLDRWPGMTMGPYGVHYERTQTWWEMAGAWHEYLARCQMLLRRGLPVADICYLAPEGAPQVFRPPPSAMRGLKEVPDRREHNFDGIAPETLLARMSVRDGKLVLPDGMQYRVLVLPEMETMTPALLQKVAALIKDGATVIGPPPRKSPSLSGYPQCDAQVQRLAAELWGPAATPGPRAERMAGKGKFIGTTPPTAEPEPPLARGKWIWHSEGNPASAAPVGARHFRRAWNLEDFNQVTSASLFMTADNSFAVGVNGQPVGEGDNFTRAYEFDIKPLLQGGANVMTVTVNNGGESPNPAGLIGVLAIRFSDGHALNLPTDRLWESAATETAPWQPALELGAWGMQPWGKPGGLSAFPPPYCDYEQVASVLAQMGVPPDFESDTPLRYTHRSEGDADIYFIANRENDGIKTPCNFRVAGKIPSLWDPVSGRILAQDSFEVINGRTRLTLSLDPHGSVFVVFQPKSFPGAAKGETPWPKLETILVISGPWQVRFQPHRGAPENTTFVTLGDWAEHADAGIRHFSGVATYRGGFEISKVPSQIFLDLGEVQVMARVKLNGRDLGVVWKIPFRLDITDAVKAGDNTLEIAVANLWPNRLIGDAGLPPEERVAWTTWNPFKQDSPLLKSGLLGPVTVQAARRGTPGAF